MSGDIAARAERYLRHAEDWTPNHELARHVGTSPHALALAMRPAVDAKTVERVYRGKGPVLYWRMTPAPPAQTFGIDWPPGFVSQWFAVETTFESRRK